MRNMQNTSTRGLVKRSQVANNKNNFESVSFFNGPCARFFLPYLFD